MRFVNLEGYDSTGQTVATATSAGGAISIAFAAPSSNVPGRRHSLQFVAAFVGAPVAFQTRLEVYDGTSSGTAMARVAVSSGLNTFEFGGLRAGAGNVLTVKLTSGSSAQELNAFSATLG